jgi:hypothetical protein
MSAAPRTERPLQETGVLVKQLHNIVRVSVYGVIIALIINAIDCYQHGFKQTSMKITRSYDQALFELGGRSAMAAAYISAGVKIASSYFSTLFSTNQSRWDYQHVNERNMTRVVGESCQIILQTVESHVAKIAAVFSSWFLFLMAYLLGTLDGLTIRYRRTEEGGRESTFVFHKVSQRILSIPTLILSAYLFLPLSFSPLWVVAGVALLLFYFSQVSAANLKKFI